MKKATFFQQISGKLTLIIGGVGVGIAVISIVIATYMESVAIHDLSILRIKNMAVGTYDYVNSWFERRKDDVNNFSQFSGNELTMGRVVAGRGQDVLADGNKALDRVRNDIRLLFNNNPYYIEAYLIDTSGEVKFHASIFEERDGVGVGRDYSKEDFFIEGRKGAFVSKIFLDEHMATILRETGQMNTEEARVPTMFVSAPFVNEDGVDAGVLAFRVDLEALRTILTRKNFGETGETYIFNADGLIVSDSRFTETTMPEELKKKYDIHDNATLKLRLVDSKGNLTEGVRIAATEQKEGFSEKPYEGYMGEKVYGYWNWMPSVQKGVMSEIRASEVNKAFMDMLYIMIGVGAGLVVLAALVGFFMAKTIADPLAYGVRFATTVAKGDLTQSVEDKYLKRPDEIGDLSRALNQMVIDLEEIVGSIVSGAENIASATNQISEGNQNLSQRTEEQSASLEETASSMEEMASTIKQTSENAMLANGMTKDAQQATQTGVEALGRTIVHMDEISAASQKISDITQLIENIAFQTNILALNAAVEAARAGEQGRGFAVVASEVRNLAQTTSASVKDISALIQDSVEKIGKGSEEAKRSGEILNDIEEKVNKVVDVMNEISAASLEQQNGVEQVNKAVTDMDSVTQHNASLVEEAASSSEELSSQAKELASVIQFFNVKQGSGNRIASPKRIAHVKAIETTKPEQSGNSMKPAQLPTTLNEKPKPAAVGGKSDDDFEEF